MTSFQLTITSKTDTTKPQLQEFNRQSTAHIITQQIKTNSKSTFIIQKQKERNWKIKTKDEEEILNYHKQVIKVLFKVSEVEENGGRCCLIEQSGYPIYEVVGKEVINKHRRLKVGDVYKIGAVRLGVLYVGSYREVRAGEREEEEGNTAVSEQDLNPEVVPQKLSCFRCRDTHNGTNNPLKLFCRCPSTNYSIHKNCLSSLLKSRTNTTFTSTNNNYYLPKKDLLCDQCHSYYSFPLLTQSLFNKPLSSFILLQDSTTFYAISCLQKSSISIGRQNNPQTAASFILANNGVSRIHAEIFHNDKRDGFWIKDSGSKFGTLRQVDKMKVVREAEIQVGRNVFRIVRREKVGFLGFLRLMCFPEREEEREQRR